MRGRWPTGSMSNFSLLLPPLSRVPPLACLPSERGPLPSLPPRAPLSPLSSVPRRAPHFLDLFLDLFPYLYLDLFQRSYRSSSSSPSTLPARPPPGLGGGSWRSPPERERYVRVRPAGAGRGTLASGGGRRGARGAGMAGGGGTMWKVGGPAAAEVRAGPGGERTRALPPGAAVRAAAAAGAEEGWLALAGPGGGFVRAADVQPLPPAQFRVAHKAVMVRQGASLSAKVVEIRKEGDALPVEGHLDGWLKVCPGEACGSFGWVLQQHPEYGVLMRHVQGDVPTFASPAALEARLGATPAAVFGEKPSQRVTEEMQLLLDSLKRDIATKETRAREKEVRMGREVDTLRKGLMAGSGDMSATGFYVGGEPI